MKNFYDALEQVKKMKIFLSPLSTNVDKKRFCSILQDLAPDYVPECIWLKRILEKDIHLEFIDKEGASFSEKKQIIGRVKKRLELEEGFGEKAIEKMISALMVIGDWKESYRNNELYEAPNNAAKNSENIKTTKSSQTSRKTHPKNVNKKNINSKSSVNNQKSNGQASSTKESQNTNTGSSNSQSNKSSSVRWNQKVMRCTSPVTGEVETVNTSIGKYVSKGEVLMTLKAEGKKYEIIAPQGGKIVSLVSRGKKVYPGDIVFTMNSLVSGTTASQKSAGLYTAQQKNNTAQTGQNSNNTYVSKTGGNQSATTQSSTQTQKTSHQSVSSSVKTGLLDVSRGLVAMVVMTVIVIIVGVWGSMRVGDSGSNVNISTEMSEAEKEEKKAQEEKEAIANAQEGDIVTFGLNNLKWRVLSKKEKKVLLITEYSVGNQPYHETEEGITWENCSLRKWLNEDFYDEKFSDAEKKLIRKQKLSNINDPEYGTDAGNDTEDKVFLLNLKEAKKYFSSNADRSIGEVWWLRSPGATSDGAKIVFSGGDFVEGNYTYAAVDVSFAVRPSLWVKISE